jgi:peroxiredoxin
MTQFESRISEIEAMGAQLAFIAAEKRDGVWKPETFLQNHPIASVFLLDEDRTVTKSYGLHHAIGKDAINIAHPATLIVARSGDDKSKGKSTIRYIYRGNNQNDRAAIDDVLKDLREIATITTNSLEAK